MPITIKKPPFKPCDRTYRKWAVFTLIASVAFTVVLSFFVRYVTDNQDASLPLTLGTAAGFLAFFTGCIGSAWAGIRAYNKEDNGAALVQGLVYVLGTVFCLLNLRFMLAVTLNACGAESAADKLIGSQSYGDFIAGNYVSWVLLAAGVLAAFVIGILGLVKIMRNGDKK